MMKKMSEENRKEAWFLFAGVLLGISFMAILLIKTTQDMEWHRDIVKHNGAYYHPKTGKFTWIEKEAK